MATEQKEVTAEDCICVSPAKNCCIILTAPHGGKYDFHPELFIERTSGQSVKKKSDLYTAEMLQEIESKIIELSNGTVKPYTIYLKVHRKYIDGNRNEKQYPYEISKNNTFSKEVYDLYHSKISIAIDEIEKQYGKGTAILLDIHGQAQKNEHLMIGTKNGKTCGYENDAKDNENNCNKNIVYNIISYALKDKNTNIHGWNEIQTKLNGGFTVCKHSGYLDNKWERICIQLEFGKKLRDNRDSIVGLLSLGLCDISVVNKQIKFGDKLKYKVRSWNNKGFVECVKMNDDDSNDFPNSVYLSRNQVDL